MSRPLHVRISHLFPASQIFRRLVHGSAGDLIRIGLNATLRTGPVCPLNERISWPVPASQISSVSPLPPTIRFPSGLNAPLPRTHLCPRGTGSSYWPVSASQTPQSSGGNLLRWRSASHLGSTPRQSPYVEPPFTAERCVVAESGDQIAIFPATQRARACGQMNVGFGDVIAFPGRIGGRRARYTADSARSRRGRKLKRCRSASCLTFLWPAAFVLRQFRALGRPRAGWLLPAGAGRRSGAARR